MSLPEDDPREDTYELDLCIEEIKQLNRRVDELGAEVLDANKQRKRYEIRCGDFRQLFSDAKKRIEIADAYEWLNGPEATGKVLADYRLNQMRNRKR